MEKITKTLKTKEELLALLQKEGFCYTAHPAGNYWKHFTGVVMRDDQIALGGTLVELTDKPRYNHNYDWANDNGLWCDHWFVEKGGEKCDTAEEK